MHIDIKWMYHKNIIDTIKYLYSKSITALNWIEVVFFFFFPSAVDLKMQRLYGLTEKQCRYILFERLFAESSGEHSSI